MWRAMGLASMAEKTMNECRLYLQIGRLYLQIGWLAKHSSHSQLAK
jgi:hypothetical protein